MHIPQFSGHPLQDKQNNSRGRIVLNNKDMVNCDQGKARAQSASAKCQSIINLIIQNDEPTFGKDQTDGMDKFHEGKQNCGVWDIQQHWAITNRSNSKTKVTFYKPAHNNKRPTKQDSPIDIVVDQQDHIGLNHHIKTRIQRAETTHRKQSCIGQIPYIPCNLSQLKQKMITHRSIIH